MTRRRRGSRQSRHCDPPCILRTTSHKRSSTHFEAAESGEVHISCYSTKLTPLPFLSSYCWKRNLSLRESRRSRSTSERGFRLYLEEGTAHFGWVFWEAFFPGLPGHGPVGPNFRCR